MSPFLAFATLLARTPVLLEGLAFVPERVGSRRSVPVFEVEPLRELVADPLRRLFFADLLASYTHVASGAIWVKSRRGWRHRRFSELDPAQFAELILTVPPNQRLVLYRRLGDLSLFLSGVFPDHAEAHPLAPIAVERLSRALAAGHRRGRASSPFRTWARWRSWSRSGDARTRSRGRRPCTATSVSPRCWPTSRSTSGTHAWC